MSFHFRCPNCNTKLEAEDDWQGMETQCPSCQQNLQIPSATSQNSFSPEINSSSEPQTLHSHFRSTRKKIAFWSPCILLLAVAITGSGYYIWHAQEPQKLIKLQRHAEEKQKSPSMASTQSKPSPEEKNRIPFLLDPFRYFPLKWGNTIQDCQKEIDRFVMSDGHSDLFEGYYNGGKFYFKFNTYGDLIGVFCPTNLIKLMQIVQLADQRFGKTGKFEERMQLQWHHKKSLSIFVAQTSQYIDGLNYTVEAWADNLYPHILQNRLDTCIAEAQNERTYEKAIKILELGIATNDKAPNLSNAKDYLNSLKSKLAAELAAKERQRIQQEQYARQQKAKQQNRQKLVSCSWGCNGTGRLPDGMRCPDHSRQLRGVIAEGVNQDTTPYCLNCGGSGQITQVIMPSEGALINSAFGGQQATAKQIRRTCPTCNGSGKRY